MSHFKFVREATAEKDELNQGQEEIKHYTHTCTSSLVVSTGKQISLYLFGRNHCQSGIKTYDNRLPNFVKSIFGRSRHHFFHHAYYSIWNTGLPGTKN